MLPSLPSARSTTPLTPPGLPRLLRARIPRQPRHLGSPRQPALARHLPGQVHQDGQVPPAHHGPVRHCPPRPLQGLGQGQRRDALFVRRKRPQGPRRPLERGLPGAPGRPGPEHERHTTGNSLFPSSYTHTPSNPIHRASASAPAPPPRRGSSIPLASSPSARRISASICARKTRSSPPEHPPRRRHGENHHCVAEFRWEQKRTPTQTPRLALCTGTQCARGPGGQECLCSSRRAPSMRLWQQRKTLLLLLLLLLWKDMDSKNTIPTTYAFALFTQSTLHVR